MSEIKLTRRYPDSRPEDITDAYMRGVAAGMEIANSQQEQPIVCIGSDTVNASIDSDLCGTLHVGGVLR